MRAEREAGGAPAQIPLQAAMHAVLKQIVPLHSMQVHSGTEIDLQPMEDLTLEQMDAQRRISPHGKPMLELLQDLQTHGK